MGLWRILHPAAAEDPLQLQPMQQHRQRVLKRAISTPPSTTSLLSAVFISDCFRDSRSPPPPSSAAENEDRRTPSQTKEGRLDGISDHLQRGGGDDDGGGGEAQFVGPCLPHCTGLLQPSNSYYRGKHHLDDYDVN